MRHGVNNSLKIPIRFSPTGQTTILKKYLDFNSPEFLNKSFESLRP
jgi:hypothetical protein